MNQHQKVLLLLVFLIASVSAIVPQNYEKNLVANLTENILQVGYSPNQRHLVVLKNQSSGFFYVFDGVHLNNMKQINLTDDNKERVSPSALKFSKNNDLLIVGSKEGGVYGFPIVKGQVSNQYQYHFVIGSKTEQNWVRSIDISTQNKIAIAAKQTLVILTVPQTPGEFLTNQTVQYNHTIYSVCWSIDEPNILFVGTVGSSQGFFLMYDILATTSTTISTQKTQSIAIFPDGKTLLKSTIGKDVDVYTYQTGAKPLFKQPLQDTNDTSKITISSNGFYFGVQTNSGQVKAWTVSSSGYTNLKNEGTDVLRGFDSSLIETGSTFALSSTGNDILIIPVNDSLQIQKFTLCLNKTYYNNEKKDCSQCSANCNTCFDSQTCISCPDNRFINGDVCLPCNTKLDGCLTCSSDQNCLSCDQQQSWNLKPEQGKCTCMETFFDKDGECKTCSTLVDCLNCAGENNCTLCKDEKNFNTSSVNGSCVCKKSFWLDDNECSECKVSITDCLDCSQDGKQCTECESQDRTLDSNQTACICVDYKYEAENKTCQFCDLHQNCIHCKEDQPTFCMQCDTNKKWKETPDNGICVCQNQFYDSEGKCTECSAKVIGCDTCTNEGACITCKKESNFDPSPQEEKCVCIERWILDSNECKECSAEINGCLTCSSVSNCSICDDNANFEKQSSEGKCLCKAQFWLNDKVCELCNTKIPGCSTCSLDGSQCLTCEDEFRQPSKDGFSCQCKPFTYSAANNSCEACDIKHSCTECSPQGDHLCIECDQINHWNLTPSEGKCYCKDGYNEFNDKCILCLIPGCSVCATENTCNECSKENKFDPLPFNNSCKCQIGTRPSDDTKYCQYCNLTITGCKQCNNANDCIQCDEQNHFFFDMDNNDCKCEISFYLTINKACEICSSAVQNCLYCTPIVKSIQCDKCQKGYATSDNKNSCISCQVNIPGCIDCDNSSKCTQCDEQNGFVMKGDKCVCASGFYLKDGKCLQCSEAIPGCKQCDDENICIECKAEERFIPEPDQNHQCQCIDEWILNDSVCKSCGDITGCKECSDIETCTRCNEEGQFELTDEKKCECKSTFWLNDNVCSPCSTSIVSCLTCSQDGSTCQSCIDPNRALNQDSTKCNCKQSTYQDLNKQCQQCDQNRNCLQCLSQDNCIKCDPTKNWISDAKDGKCLCKPGYLEWNNSCVLCQVVGCTQCHQENYCSVCDESERFNTQAVDGKCNCQQNTHPDGDQCFYCADKITGCSQCQNLNQCTACNDDQYFVLNQTTKKCQCNSAHYFVQPKCVQCNIKIDHCNQCIVNDEVKECNKCDKGFIVSEEKETCLSCSKQILGCTYCSSTKVCQQCDEMDNFELVNSQCICKKGYFLQTEECTSCQKPIPGCQDCDKTGKQCSQCDKSRQFELNKDTSVCQCTKGFYLNGQECDECSQKITGCSECSKDGSACSTCEEGYYLAEGVCNKCASKVAGCTKCSADGQKCLQCDTQNFIINQTTSQCDCIQSYYKKGSQCQLCDTQLLSCSKCNQEGTECYGCKNPHFMLNSETKLCECEESYFLKNKLCTLCSLEITGCSKCNKQDGSECSECDSEEKFVLNNSRCSCVGGYFLNSSQKACQVCSDVNPGCTLCGQNGQQCMQCNTENFVYNQQTKSCECMQNYYTASTTECKLCSSSIDYCISCVTDTTDFIPYCAICKDNFQLTEDGTLCACSGKDKQLVNGQCITNDDNNWLFYLAISGGAIIIIGIGIWVYLKIKKNKLVRLDSYNELQGQKSNRSKQQTILTDGSASKLAFKSSVYQLEDEQQ